MGKKIEGSSREQKKPLPFFNKKIAKKRKYFRYIAIGCLLSCSLYFSNHNIHLLTQPMSDGIPVIEETNQIRNIDNLAMESYDLIDREESGQRESSLDSIPRNYTENLYGTQWKCSDLHFDLNSKLIFVHVFKTAGTSMRGLLDVYGHRCGRGVVTITHCSNLPVESLTAADPKEAWKHCQREMTIHRGGGAERNITMSIQKARSAGRTKRTGNSMNWHHLHQNADILSGHLPLGIHQHWFTNETRTELVDVQYVTFIRDPYARFISGRLFMNQNKDWTFQQAVEFIRTTILKKVEKKQNENVYFKYFLTPHQKQRHGLSKDEKVQLIKKNLIQMNVLVGAVEHMDDSMALLQSIIDVDREETFLFETLSANTNTNTNTATVADETLTLASSKSSPQHGSRSNNNQETKHLSSSKPELLLVNKSKWSTSDIVHALQQDQEAWDAMTILLQYEIQSYEFAFALHRRQVAVMKERYGERYRMRGYGYS